MQKIKFRTLSLLVLVGILGSGRFSADRIISGLTSEISPKSEIGSSKTNSAPKFDQVLGVIFNDEAVARGSGGRSGGGSFRRSSPSNNPPARSNSGSNSAPIQPNRSGGNTIIAPIFIPGGGGYYNNPGYGNNYSSSNNYGNNSGGGWIALIIILLGIGGIGFLVYRLIKSMNFGGNAGGSELSNNKVTVSKLQVGLLAEARKIQHELSEISLGADTDSPEGLTVLLQEAAIALLRTPENWVYVSASSQSLDRDQAEGLFNNLSVAERSKFSAETLVNVGGRTRTSQNFKPDPSKDPAAYIVVTLLIGTEYDQPLFAKVNSRETLQKALEKMAGVSPEALSIFELLWTPQADSDALTADEMLTEYADMVSI